jgi:membrane protein
MSAHFDLPISWMELAKRTYREAMDDDALGLAAQLAYYFFLSLFPALLCLLAVASLFPLENLVDDMIGTLGPFAPREVVEIIRQQMLSLSERNDTGLLSVGLLGAIWSSSAAMVAVTSSMNKAYDIEEGRPWWKVRLTAILLTIGLAVFILASFTLVLAGPQIAENLAGRIGLGPAFVWTWKILQWPVAFLLVSTGLGFVYYFAPDADQDWVWITPGSLVATGLWLLGSIGFRFYAVNFGNYEATYGAVAAVILLMLWFYLSALVIVLGAELNAEIEHASPWGKAPGEKREPGVRKKIGAAAARAWREQPRPAVAPAPMGESRPFTEPALQPTFFERLATYATLLLRWRNRSKS